jgi:hypothetical protein
MDRTVRDHIARLAEEIASLEKRAQSADDELARREIEADIRDLRLAAAHYELALKLEGEILTRPSASKG